MHTTNALVHNLICMMHNLQDLTGLPIRRNHSDKIQIHQTLIINLRISISGNLLWSSRAATRPSETDQRCRHCVCLGVKGRSGISKGCLAFSSKPNSTRNLWGIFEMNSQIWEWIVLLKVPGGIYMQAPNVGDWPNDPHGMPILSKTGGT